DGNVRNAQYLRRQPTTELAGFVHDDVRLPVAGDLKKVRQRLLGEVAGKRPGHHERQEVVVWADAKHFPSLPQTRVANAPVESHREGLHSAGLEMRTEAGGAGAGDLMSSRCQSLGDG